MAAPTSPLQNLRDRVEDARRRAIIDLDIEGLPGFHVRYRALDAETLHKLVARGKKDSHAANVSALAMACVSVFVDDDLDLGDHPFPTLGTDGQLHGDPVTFNSDVLADTLQLDTPARPAETVPFLFPIEGQVASHATMIANFSTGESSAVARSALGN